ncbi:SpoIVB peptidase [Clostridium sp. YIM B02515]|uniref:SpoIVB peptidase n=1 Tax=Clostridium rhizosphaerae TaxID=2803861 RepID=A0ABS1TIW5_9CLOT|nr:SpoIVB peptidase [Clostridium rhizosphaerae]MBL4937898.1 SpoIVB peptidase [Clostridium rhizosphaerae]
MKKKLKRILCWILTPLTLLTLSIYYNVYNIPTTMFVREGQEIKSNQFIRLNEENEIKVNNLIQSNSSIRKLKVSFLGLVPLKSISVRSVPSEISLYPGGQPVGVKLNTKGVLVVALSDIETVNGKSTSPGALSGIQVGDSILKINNENINSSEQVSKIVNSCKGKELTVIVMRKGSELIKNIKPIQSSSDDKYKIGLWVRDSTAGVGTLTFFDDKSKKFAALGHPITDADTGTLLNISSGQIINSSIVSVRKGARGNPGELKGIFVDEDITLGDISKNTDCGIFGSTNKSLINSKFNKPMKIALRQEIKEGPAKIITTIDGGEPKTYDIEIQKLLQQEEPGPKSMVIKITDPVLLEKTGGIVQGMSGSPIIQNNKLVGAVTHVLINKPDVGYGIYIEWMLKDADILTK